MRDETEDRCQVKRKDGAACIYQFGHWGRHKFHVSKPETERRFQNVR